jgi:parallel beta-helix repeat protein
VTLQFYGSGLTTYIQPDQSVPAPTSGPGLCIVSPNSPGANAGAKIAACIAALPATGGTVDARGLQGAQTITQDIFAGVTKPVKLLLGHATFTVTGFIAADFNKIGIEIPSYVSILGVGEESTVIRQANGDNQWAIIRSKGAATNNRLENFTVDGNKANNVGANQAYGIHFQAAAADSVIQHVTVRDLYGYTGSTSVGIAGSATVNMLVEANTVKNSGDVGHATDGIFFSGTRNRITHNYISACTDTGIVVENATDPIVEGNHTTGMAQGIVWSGGGAGDSIVGGSISHNTILSSGAAAGGAALRLQKTAGTSATHIAVTGNVIRSLTGAGNDTRGIWANEVSYATLTGNEVSGFSTVDGHDGIRVTLSSHIILSSNIVTNNGGYGIVVVGSSDIMVAGNTTNDNNRLRITDGVATNSGIRIDDSGATVSTHVTIVGNLGRDTAAAPKYQNQGLVLAGGADNIFVAGNDFRFNRVNPGYLNSATGNVRLGFNLTNDTANTQEQIDYLKVKGNLVLLDNNYGLQGTTSGAAIVNLFKLTSDANNISRFFAGVDAGGFSWVNQAASVNWARLIAGVFEVKRLKTDFGTALAAGDFALHANWGNAATVGTVRGTDQFFSFVVTSAGAGQGASPTLTLTYHDGTWTTAPPVTCNRQDFTSQPTVTFSVNDTSATVLILTFNGTPVAAETYKLVCHVGGI